MVADSLEDVVQDVLKKRKGKAKAKGKASGKGAAQDEDCSSENEEDSEDEAGSPEANLKEEGKKPKWYDAETKNLKAERDFNRVVDGLRTAMSTTLQSMTAVVAEFRQSSDAKDVCCFQI